MNNRWNILPALEKVSVFFFAINLREIKKKFFLKLLQGNNTNNFCRAIINL